MRKLYAVAAFSALLAVPASAQNTDIEALAGLQFSFGNPGARSLGMGGAFLGLADDATAAEANPAGLTILRQMEVSVEGRHSENDQTFAVGGDFPDLETASVVNRSRRVELNFASVVIPAGNFAFAGYFHQPLAQNSDTTVLGTDIFFYLGENGPVTPGQCENDPECGAYFLYPFRTAVEMRMKTTGAAFAYKMGTFSIGAAARYQQFEESAFTFRTNEDFIPLSFVAQVADDNDVTFSAGFKWEASPSFSVGGVYKQGAEFETSLQFRDLLNDGDVIDVAQPMFNVPDVYGVGFAWRPVPTLTLLADAVNIDYSALADDFYTVYQGIDGDEFYEIEDTLEYHLGAEYFFATSIPVALRAGWWRDPAHELEYVGPLTFPNAVAARILYPGGEDQDHYSVGVGLAWPRFQIDAAYDTADAVRTGSVSFVARF